MFGSQELKARSRPLQVQQDKTRCPHTMSPSGMPQPQTSIWNLLF